MRGLGSPSCSAGMPNPPPKNRRLVRGWVWEREEGMGEGRGRRGKGRKGGDERSMYVG